jgi:hypothetical protein
VEPGDGFEEDAFENLNDEADRIRTGRAKCRKEDDRKQNLERWCGDAAPTMLAKVLQSKRYEFSHSRQCNSGARE